VEHVGHRSDDTDVTATLEEFQRIELRVGRVVAVEDFPAARNPSYKLTIDLGPYGTKRSSAAIRPWYTKEQLQGRLVVCVTNFPPRRIATFDSEVLTLGAVDEAKRVTLLQPDADCALGSRIA
jgi:tRNA-binding protein